MSSDQHTKASSTPHNMSVCNQVLIFSFDSSPYVEALICC